MPVLPATSFHGQLRSPTPKDDELQGQEKLGQSLAYTRLLPPKDKAAEGPAAAPQGLGHSLFPHVQHNAALPRDTVGQLDPLATQGKTFWGLCSISDDFPSEVR